MPIDIHVAREALLEDARARAARRLAAADAETDQRIAAARREAATIIAQARARGETEGRIAGARDAAVQRSFAHLKVLAAQRDVYDEFRRRARDATLALRDDPAYPALLDRLTASARRDLGDGAEIERDPPEVGGVRARDGTRSVDYTLPALADRAIAELGPRLRAVWT
jgi:vacuolar-type H+-ATPase subunit E/Vma4